MRDLSTVLIVAASVVIIAAAFWCGVQTHKMRNRAAAYAGHPPRCGNDVDERELLHGLQMEFGRLCAGAKDLYDQKHYSSIEADADFLLNAKPLYDYLVASLERDLRREDKVAVAELCAKAKLFSRQGGTNVAFMANTDQWIWKVHQWCETVWWLAPALADVADELAASAA